MAFFFFFCPEPHDESGLLGQGVGQETPEDDFAMRRSGAGKCWVERPSPVLPVVLTIRGDTIDWAVPGMASKRLAVTSNFHVINSVIHWQENTG